jgi:hypothetical protein
MWATTNLADAMIFITAISRELLPLAKTVHRYPQSQVWLVG